MPARAELVSSPSRMEPSAYQNLKMALLAELHLSRDAFHLYIGLACLVIFALVSRRGFATLWALAPGLAVSLSIELLDLLDDRTFFGYPRWGASLHDLMHTNMAPLVLVLVAKLAARRQQSRRRLRS